MAPRPEVTKFVRNQSSRGGVAPDTIVLHSTEGPNRAGLVDLRGLGEFFDRASVQASSHVANDAEGNDARYVADERKAWTCASWNPRTLNVEQIGYASQRAWPDAQVENTAQWVAYWSRKYGIPIRRAHPGGVCFHSDLGAAGGGHHDPGAGFPIEACLRRAEQIAGGLTPQREARWRRSLRIQRSRLRSILAGRAHLRQRKLEGTARYAWATRAMRATRERIARLKRLIAR